MSDPEYERIFTQARVIAWQYGFSVLRHGTATRDLDLLMVPWTEVAKPTSVRTIIHRIASVADLRLADDIGTKPHGRTVYTMILPDSIRWVDLSVTPFVGAA